MIRSNLNNALVTLLAFPMQMQRFNLKKRSSMNFNTDISQPDGATELRRRAVDKMNVNGTTARPGLNPAGPQRLLQELQLHQLELEMQTTELREARDEREAVLLKYTNLYDFAPVSYFTLDRERTINALNLTGSSLLSVERSGLIGQSFGQFVTIDDQLDSTIRISSHAENSSFHSDFSHRRTAGICCRNPGGAAVVGRKSASWQVHICEGILPSGEPIMIRAISKSLLYPN